MRFARSRMDIPSFRAMRDLSAEQVVRRDGMSVDSYRLGGTYTLTDGQTYDFRVRYVAGNTPSDWSDVVTLRAAADVTLPGPATGFIANGGAGQFAYAFTAPNSDNFGSAVAYLGTTTNFGDATVLRTFNGAASQSFDRTEMGQAAGAYRLWIRALNRSGYGDGSSTAGPMTVMVT